MNFLGAEIYIRQKDPGVTECLDRDAVMILRLNDKSNAISVLELKGGEVKEIHTLNSVETAKACSGDIVDFLFKPENPSFKIGDRVKRGPHWKWLGQDCDNLGDPVGGTITRFHNTLHKWVKVRWDTGVFNYYRAGADGAFDIEVVS